MQAKPVFRPSFGNRPDQLVGREGVLERMIEGLQAYPGSAERAILVTGQRGMGKTALLLEVADRAEELDYVAARVTCGEAMLDNVIDVLQRSGSRFVKEQRNPVKGFSAGALGFSFGLTFTEEAQRSFGFRVKLEMICERLAEAGKRVLLLVDEVSPGIDQMRTLASTYQELVGDEADIAIVLAGLPSALSGVLNYKTLTFLNRADAIKLEAVSIAEVQAYYHSAFSRAGIVSSKGIEERAARATGGFPYLIQLVGYYLSKFSVPDVATDSGTLERAIAASMSDFDSKVLQAMLNPLSNGDIAFLEAMAQDDGPVAISDIGSRLGAEHGTVQTYRKRLLDAGVIVSPRRGQVAFAAPPLANYLRRMKSEG